MKRKLIYASVIVVMLCLVSTSIYFYINTKKLETAVKQQATQQRQSLTKAIDSNNTRHQQEINLISKSERYIGIISAFDSTYYEPQTSAAFFNQPLTTYKNRTFSCLSNSELTTNPLLLKIKSEYPLTDPVLLFCKSDNQVIIGTIQDLNLHFYQVTLNDFHNILVKNSETQTPLIGNSQNKLTVTLLKWKTAKMDGDFSTNWFKFQTEELVDKDFNPQWESAHINKYIYQWQDSAEPNLIEKCLINLDVNQKQKNTQCTHITSTNITLYGK